MNNKLIAAAIAIFALIIVVIIVIFALSSGKTKTTTPTTNGNITLTVWRTFDEDYTYSQIIQNYQEAHPNVTIKYVKKDLADYEDATINALAAGTGPDIWSINNTWIPRDLDKLVTMPDDFFKTKKETRNNQDYYSQTFAKIVSNDNLIDGKIYGLPMYVDNLALYVNQQLWDNGRSAYRKANSNNQSFDDSLFRNFPGTWDELLAELPYLTKKDASGNITQGGIALGTANNTSFSADILSLLMMQNGTTMVDTPTKSARFNTLVNDASGKPIYNGTNALDFYTSFSNPAKSNYTWNNSQPNALQAFENGQLAMMIGYQYIAQTLKQQAPTLQYQVTYMPQVKGATTVNYANYWTETVTNNSRNQSTAWDFLAYAATHANSYLNATKRTSALLPDPRNPKTSDPFIDQVTTSTTWEQGKSPEKVTAAFNDMINNVLKGQPLQQSIDAAANTVTDLLQK
ncbi:MAG: extracellular solute-binding protein [Patescibacteria group bacterium]|jgi:ABC-type glycerol-3-phosphate transport system substrate-binding protein